MLGTESSKSREEKGKVLKEGEIDLVNDIIEINGELLEVKKVLKIGGSFAFLVPRLWLEMFCKEQDGSFLIAYKLGDSIIELIGTQDPYRRQEK